jgi:hypothetical protein
MEMGYLVSAAINVVTARREAGRGDIFSEASLVPPLLDGNAGETGQGNLTGQRPRLPADGENPRDGHGIKN